eukprot:1685262-Pyramimonas_sp.AAC.1
MSHGTHSPVTRDLDAYATAAEPKVEPAAKRTTLVDNPACHPTRVKLDVASACQKPNAEMKGLRKQ